MKQILTLLLVILGATLEAKVGENSGKIQQRYKRLIKSNQIQSENDLFYTERTYQLDKETTIKCVLHEAVCILEEVTKSKNEELFNKIVQLYTTDGTNWIPTKTEHIRSTPPVVNEEGLTIEPEKRDIVIRRLNDKVIQVMTHDHFQYLKKLESKVAVPAKKKTLIDVLK